MAQYDIPILQENASGKFVPTTLAPPAARRKIGLNPSRGLELFVSAAASVYCTASAASQAAASSSTWYKITSFDTNGDASGATPAHGTDNITLSEAGLYLVGFNATITGTNANEIQLAVYKNGTTRLENTRIGVMLGSTNAHHLTACAPVNFAANDTIELWFQNVTGANAIVVREGCLWCAQLC